MNETNIRLMEFYLGDIIDEIITKYKYSLDFEEEYDAFLVFIYKALVNSIFKGKEPSSESLEKKLKMLRKRDKDKLEILISYLLSKFINNNEEEILKRISTRGKRR